MLHTHTRARAYRLRGRGRLVLLSGQYLIWLFETDQILVMEGGLYLKATDEFH